MNGDKVGQFKHEFPLKYSVADLREKLVGALLQIHLSSSAASTTEELAPDEATQYLHLLRLN